MKQAEGVTAGTSTDSGQKLRGGFWLSAAKLYFIVIGLLQQVGLTWILGDSYGALRGALSPASVTYGPLLTSGVQGLSRAVTQDRAREGAQGGEVSPETTARETQSSALWFQLAVALVAAIGFGLGAPLLGRLLHSPHLVAPFQILAWVILCYGCYAPLIGILNGAHRFMTQASLDALAATLRTLALLVGAWLGGRATTPSGVQGACVGFALASGVMLLVAVFLARPRLGGVSWPKLREHASYMLPVLGSQAVLNLLLQSDTNLLRAFAARAASSEGLPVAKADALVGAYAAAQLFGYLPYQVLVGVTFLLFPLLSGASARNERSEVARLVGGGVRVAALVTGLVVAVTAGLSAALLRLVFPPQMAELAGTAMVGLCLGLGCFAMFGVFSSVLISLGRPWYAFIATTAAWLLSSGANTWVLLGQPFGAELLVYTASSSALAILGATALSGYWVLQAANALIKLKSALRVLLSLAVAIGLARLLSPSSKPATLLAALLVSAVYVAGLMLSKELSVSELQTLGRALLGRRLPVGKS